MVENTHNVHTGEPSRVIVVNGQEKRPIHEPLIAASAMLGGGILAADMTLKQLNGLTPFRDVDITKLGSWEVVSDTVQATEAQTQKVASDVNNLLNNISNQKDSFPDAAATPATARVKSDTVVNALKEEVNTASKRPKVVNAADASRLMNLKPSDVAKLQIQNLGDGKYSATIHTNTGGKIIIPEIKRPFFEPKAEFMLKGAILTFDEAAEFSHLNLKGGIVEDALSRRKQALIEDLGQTVNGKNTKTFIERFKGFKHLDEMGKLNVVGMAVVGVAAGALVASAVNGMIRGTSHAANYLAASQAGQGAEARR